MIFIWATSQNCAGKKEKEKLKISNFQKKKKEKEKIRLFFQRKILCGGK
jgi:hypothetical protein